MTTTIDESLENQLHDYHVAFAFKGLPVGMWPGLHDYIATGAGVGGFLNAVLTNNLAQAVGRADDRNKPLLHVWVSYLYNTLPTGSWGSPQAVEQWRKNGGLKGRLEAAK